MASESHGKVMWLKINGRGSSSHGYLVATDRLITAGNGLRTQTWLRWHIRRWRFLPQCSSLQTADIRKYGGESLDQNHGRALQKSIRPSVNMNHTQCQDSKHWHLTLSKRMWCRYTPTWWTNQLPEFLPATNSVNKPTCWLCFHSNTCFTAPSDNFQSFLIGEIKCQRL